MSRRETDAGSDAGKKRRGGIHDNFKMADHLVWISEALCVRFDKSEVILRDANSFTFF